MSTTGAVLPWGKWHDLGAEIVAWFHELQALPPDTDPSPWLIKHADGRRWVGMRVGTFLVDCANASHTPAAPLVVLPTDEIVQRALPHLTECALSPKAVPPHQIAVVKCAKVTAVKRHRSLVLALSLGLPGLVFACGSRTGLLADGSVADGDMDGATKVDAARTDAPVIRDAQVDSLPPLDAQRDVSLPPPLGCADAGDTQIYLITAESELLAFYPPTSTFTTVGPIACPSAPGETPFSMGVERSGTAFAVFTDGRLFRISTATAACAATRFVPGQQGYTTFGMGYAGDQVSEKLYVSDNVGGSGLATINTSTFQLSRIGPFNPALPMRCELTGTGANELYAYCVDENASGGIVALIDRATARVVAADRVVVGGSTNAFAFAHWGGNFYIFTSAGAGSTVTRFDPIRKVETVVASHPSTIVGAGVSTCAPN